MCVSALKKLIKQLGRQACCDRALGLFRTGEEPRSIVQSRTIERRVLGDIGSQTILLCAPTRRQGRIDLDLRSMGTREALAQVRGALPIGPRRRGAGRPVGWGSQRIKLRGGSDDAGSARRSGVERVGERLGAAGGRSALSARSPSLVGVTAEGSGGLPELNSARRKRLGQHRVAAAGSGF